MNTWKNYLFSTVFMALAASGCTSGNGLSSEDSGTVLGYDIDMFFNTLDLDRDGYISEEEWTEMGLRDVSFALCDADNNGMISRQEMAACAVPVDMDPAEEGILTIYAGGRFVIPSPELPFPKPAKAPPGITRATQFVADSPYVEGGPIGEDFIKLFDRDGDGKISHMEWESQKNDTVFAPFRWPQYNRNRDEWITLDEAPQPPEK